MKYSQSKQKVHMEKVLKIMTEQDPDFSRLGSRQICSELELEGLHLSRGYVMKLMDRVAVLVEKRIKRGEHLSDAIQDWIREFRNLIGEFYLKLNAQLRRYPPYKDDDLEDFDFEGPADLSEEPRHN